MSGFIIFALPVADGILALSPLPGRGGHYKEDLAHLRDWKPALVLTMVTEPELVGYGASDLGSDIQDSGARWIHMPVKDMEVPDTDQIEAWHTASKAALAALQGGGRVLIHCLGGCGRSGMAALRLMVEAGESPEAALHRLRGVRACAVETEAQKAWAISV
ncbi:protein-tyrosine phosphatase family protein [Roseovarius aestuariivivens]|uniref:protein-tyrosine phosphatase family protein n=1 Tax=Roseovarius aestuariivivens TaxID=1888910 RepID=UPI001081A5E1|nr:dual specificity protein phosphatase family protein [Roseovarius aestuariivivens]